MLLCDICNAEIEGRRDDKKVILPYEYSCKAFQTKEFDLCNTCHALLNRQITIAKMKFTNKNKGNSFCANCKHSRPTEEEKIKFCMMFADTVMCDDYCSNYKREEKEKCN